jgi:hypothetical protein
MSLVHAYVGGPVVAMTRWVDRQAIGDFTRATQGKSLTSRVGTIRPMLLDSFRSFLPTDSCPTCTWWDFRSQKPTRDTPHTSSVDIDQKSLKLDKRYYETLLPPMNASTTPAP